MTLLLILGLAVLDYTVSPCLAQDSVQVLVLVPFFDSSRVGDGYDRGIELLPAARLARDEINLRENLLPGYQLQLIEASSDACDITVPSSAVLNFTKEAIGLYGNKSVLGVLGLVCSTVTTAISPLAGRDEVGLIQMSMATSPMLLNTATYPRLWRVIQTSLVEVNAFVALMSVVNWSSIAVISDDTGVFYLTTASTIRDEVRASGGNVTVSTTVTDSQFTVNNALKLIQTNGARIVFLSVTIPEATALMCEAADLGLIWPAYVWIFHSKTIEELTASPPCELHTLLRVLENVILLNVQLQQENPETVLVSNKTFEEFRKEYVQRLHDLVKEPKYKQYASEIVEDNPYANAMYDEMWAFALALSNSLDELGSLKEYQLGNLTATSIIERELGKISFSGAGGNITFTANNEAQTKVNCLQVRNGTTVLLGVYDSGSNSISLQISEEQVPSDQFVIHQNVLPMYYTIIACVVNSVNIAIITVVLVLNLCLSNTMEIKATSPFLSILTFVGLYMFALGHIVRTLEASYIWSTDILILLCYISFWLIYDGIITVISVNLVKVFRIYRIFSHFGKLGKCYSDWALFFYVLILSLPTKLCLLVTLIADPVSTEILRTEKPTDIPPTIELRTTCKSGALYVSSILLTLYCVIIAGGLVVLGYYTRKIGRHRFKDTKALIISVFVIVLVSFVTLPLIYAFDWHGMVFESNFTDLIGKVVTIWVVLIFMFFPKIVIAFHHHCLLKSNLSLGSLHDRLS